MPIAELGTEALILAVLLSMPVLATAVSMGLLIGVLQAATQVQDASLSFVPKFLLSALALTLSATWMGRELIAFTIKAWSTLL